MIDSEITMEDLSSMLQPSSDPLPANLVQSLDRIGAALMTPPATNSHSDQDSLSNYASLSAHDRMSVVEDMIVKSVGNENFITLCQDVFACWQRIGLDP
jgi:hypothetical protein